MIKVNHLSKKFGNLEVLKDINLDINEGEVVCIIGPSGSGKSTFLRCINQLERPTGGTVQYEGKNLLDKYCDIRKFREEVGMVFQKFNLFPLKTVVQNVMMAPILTKHMNKEEAHAKALELLDKVGLKDKADVYPSTLSGRQQQRVAIARALVNEPKVLLLDEPLGALDLKLRKDMQIELKRIQQSLEITFIYVTHDQEEALTMSDTVVVMNNGDIQQIGSPVDIYNEPKNAFVADFIGESNILNGKMVKDLLVEINGHRFECVDTGFGENKPVDVVIRPEDIQLVKPDDSHISGVVQSVTFKGVHYEMLIEAYDHDWLVHSTKAAEVGSTVGIKFDPYDIHIMHKMND